MAALLDHPAAFLPVVVVILLLAGFAGLALRLWVPRLASSDHRHDLAAIQASVLGLLGLLLGFSFSMAVNRYDLRRQLEIDEANAIGTTWLRTANLDQPARTEARRLLRAYVPLRAHLFPSASNPAELAQNARDTDAIQTQLWTIASDAANLHPDPVHALVLATLNDSIDLSEKRTAALENRIPGIAWIMLLFISATASLLTGLSLTSRSTLLLCILPVVVGAALTLILDLDTARSGFVQIQQQSMLRLEKQMQDPR